MSHELRTPLNAILGFTQVMQLDQSLTGDHQRYVGIINQSGEHLLGLINDVLELSKIEAGRITLYETEFDLHQLLHSLSDMLQLKAVSKGLELNFEYDANIPQYIKTDENKLRQVLINLLGNAIKFTNQGKVTLRVRATENPQVFSSIAYQLYFEVEDTGLGIAAHELTNLFQPFQQTTAGQLSKEGTGLGLRISQKFVELMGGEITVRSQLNQGSCFAFYIHADDAQVVSITSASNFDHLVSLTPGQTSYRIMIVEDNATNRLLLNTMLSQFSFELREVENGQQAIALWQEWQPHLILMDMRMPIMNGYDATRKIRQLESEVSNEVPINRTKIIAITASAFKEQRKECILAGCNDFIRKPFQREELLNLLTKHLGLQYLIPATATIDEQVEDTTNSILAQPNLVFNRTALAIMSDEWISQLHFAAVQGNDTTCINLIWQIPPHETALIIALNRLVENYQFDEIIEIIQST